MMKRILVSAIIAAASINAYAESNVTLYGVIDQAVAVTKHKHEAAKVRIDDGIYAGSRFGIKGTEDLGNGNSVGFILEQGFYAESGDAAFEGKAFSRESLLQAKGKWGEVAFGRAGGLSSDCGTYTILHGSALWTSYYTDGNVAGVFVTSDRMDNMVIYKSPEFANTTVTAMYSNGIGGDEQKWSHNDHYYGIGLDFNKNETVFSVMVEMYDNKDLNADKTYLVTLGGQQGFGDWTFWAGYQYAKGSQMMPAWKAAPTGLSASGVTQHAVTAAIGYMVFGGEWKLQGNYAHGKVNEDNQKYNIYSVGTVYEYPLSMRTQLYAYAGYGKANKYLKNDGDFNSWTACLGISHNF